MSVWGRETFGEPCRECGFTWTLTLGEAVAVIAAAPQTYRTQVVGASGRETASGLTWNVAAYVAHVTDNLRIWGGAAGRRGQRR